MLHDRFVQYVAAANTNTRLSRYDSLFYTFPYAIEDVDETFQQSNRPNGNHTESKAGKHHLYGNKVEISVRTNGVASSYSRNYPESVAVRSDHKIRLQKAAAEQELNDNSE